MYDPITARFMQEDTYRGQENDPLSLNLYTYCHNEPIMYYDYNGHYDKVLYKGITDKISQVISTIQNAMKKASSSKVSSNLKQQKAVEEQKKQEIIDDITVLQKVLVAKGYLNMGNVQYGYYGSKTEAAERDIL